MRLILDKWRSRNTKLWTVCQDYFATGEGRTLMARIGYAENAQTDRRQPLGSACAPSTSNSDSLVVADDASHSM